MQASDKIYNWMANPMGYPPRVWKFAAGHTGSITFWNDFREHDRIALGHLKNRDLSKIRDSPKLEIELRKMGQSSNVVRQFKDFFRMKRGDIVLCYLRVGRLMGIGLVENDNDYRYSKKALNNGQNYPHRRAVTWLKHFAELDLRRHPDVYRALVPRGQSDTIHEVDDKRVIGKVLGWVNRHLNDISLEIAQASELTHSRKESTAHRRTEGGASAAGDETLRPEESRDTTSDTAGKRHRHLATETGVDLFEIGRVYLRVDIHARYGGQGQGGISTPAEYPFILLFRESGQKYGYRDGWEADGTFLYTGEGQVGDMQFIGGNLAIRDHALNGEDLHLFQYVSPGNVRYIDQMVYAGHKLVGGVPDRNNNIRTAIVFQLVPMQAPAAAPRETPVDSSGKEVRRSWYWDAPLHEVHAAAVGAQQKEMKAEQVRRSVYHRIEAVRAYALRRANGRCEGCDQLAPFKTPDGRPYLEPHHTRRISDGGPDHPRWVIAVCPTCHKRAHYADDAETFNESLKSRLTRLNSQE